MTDKKKYFLNAHIIDPCNSINEIGGLIIDEQGKIEASGKRVNILAVQVFITTLWLISVNKINW